jgi:hypothetical protein
MRLKWLRLLAAALVMLGFLAACGDDDEEATDTGTEATAAASKVTVKTLEYAYEVGETTFAGGLVELTLDNTTGKESHEAGMVRLEEGKTLDDFRTNLATAAPEAPPPAWQVAAGGPGPIFAGTTAVYTANLDPGTYVLACYVPAPDGQPHAAKGMVTSVTVTDGEEGELPGADATIGAKEYAFTGIDELTAGEQTVLVENQGQEPHFWAIVQNAPGKTAQDVNGFFTSQAPPAGPPPFTGFPGLVSSFGPGGKATRTLELEPGTYTIFCLIAAPDGQPHSNKGMLTEFKIT